MKNETKKVRLRLNNRVFEVDIDKTLRAEDEIMSEAHDRIAEQLERNNEKASIVLFEELVLEDTSLFLVTYKDEETIEGYVKSKKEFDTWLKLHNARRKEEGEMEEDEDEFELKRMYELVE